MLQMTMRKHNAADDSMRKHIAADDSMRKHMLQMTL